MRNAKKVRTAMIASGQTTSQLIDLLDYEPVALHIPSAFTGTTITIIGCDTKSGKFKTVQDGEGADLNLQVTVNKIIPIPNLGVVSSLRYIKIVSSSTEAAKRLIKVVTRGI